MNRGRGTASVVASPVMVGAVTLLVVIVAMFLAYNANKGLPFVPTFDLSAQLPSSGNLVPGNEVRVGGFRVGLIDDVRPARFGGRNIAVADMKLDKSIQPLAADTQVVVRSRSAIGLKYLALTPGTSSRTFAPGDTISIRNSSPTVQVDDLLDTFDERTRLNNQAAVVGLSGALAGRGQSLNEAIAALNPFFRFLEPVASNLADPRTGINELFRQIGATSAQVAPVARTNAAMFTLMANTLAAIGRCPTCLQDTISKGPPTEDTAIASLQVQRPFLVAFTDLSRRLTPAAHELRVGLPPLNAALAVGTPVSRSAVTLSENTRKLFEALDFLAKDPNTLLALTQLRDTLSVTKPLINFIAPYETVCKQTTLFFANLGDIHSEPTGVGTAQYVLVKANNGPDQPNNFDTFAIRPLDIPSDKDPLARSNTKLQWLHATPFSPAIDARGNANCQNGQFGYLRGPLAPGGVDGPYPAAPSIPGDSQNLTKWEDTLAGGSHPVVGNYAALAGTTFTGYPNLKSVP